VPLLGWVGRNRCRYSPEDNKDFNRLRAIALNQPNDPSDSDREMQAFFSGDPRTFARILDRAMEENPR